VSSTLDISTGYKGQKSGRASSWRIVATGAPVSANVLHCATVPDGPNGWAEGEYERIEALNRKRLAAVT
jgi:hypothetical protein